MQASIKAAIHKRVLHVKIVLLDNTRPRHTKVIVTIVLEGATPPPGRRNA